MGTIILLLEIVAIVYLFLRNSPHYQVDSDGTRYCPAIRMFHQYQKAIRHAKATAGIALAPAPTQPKGVATELEALLRLREANVLKESEFQTQKQNLLQ